ncbi:HdeD family acid-resistance protein [Nonomuraea gerenzanensis]|uniref:Putative membrane protein n=1 Tax=Nonomuraea gerenzanensis TaxID=93944 RepID=A0A1M4EN18_9ACTN|nr:HdeD family acid-resistance protein [Nonomuraea gerenzanensis]UBU11718.1 HdeD family acid-resistance protein [Nonomuraea gerenzanensis]SBP00218.1 putative membrane protein [Nonomuraea gerenzanensis]
MGEISRSWWLLLVRGLAAVLFGVLALIWPGITLLVLVIFFGAYALVSGLFALFAGFRHGARSRTWLIVSGIIGILAGIVAFVWPGITSLALLYVVAFWAIFSGVSEIAAGIHLRKLIDDEWMFIVGGALSVIFGVLLLIWPGAGLVSLVWLVGVFAILYGIAMIALSMRVKNFTPRADVP